MNCTARYGNKTISLTLPDSVEQIKINPPGESPDKFAFQKNLGALLKPEPVSTGIIVSDKTRLCSYELLLPWIVETLGERGIRKNNITFYIAYGTHPRQTDKESLKTYGSLYNDYHFVHHDCDDHSVMKKIGRTSSGTDIKVRKDIFENDQLILCGAISHHYFAGYGGGRKLIFPGLADREAIYSNHKLFINFEDNELDRNCRSGNLINNPVAEDLLEIDKKMPFKTIISGILNEEGKVSKVIMGNDYSNFLDACNEYDSHYRIKDEKKYDNVIASCGGYPKDINIIQTHKSIHNAASFVKDGGNLYILAECRDGIGNDSFLNIFNSDKSGIYNNLKTNYSGNGGTALALITKTERININMLTSLDHSTCQKLGINKLNHGDIRAISSSLSGSSAIIDNASIIYC